MVDFRHTPLTKPIRNPAIMLIVLTLTLTTACTASEPEPTGISERPATLDSNPTSAPDTASSPIPTPIAGPSESVGTSPSTPTSTMGADGCVGNTAARFTEAECELAGRFAPILRMHPDEKYIPRAVDGFIAQSDLIDGNGNTIVSGEAISLFEDLNRRGYTEDHYIDAPDEIRDSMSQPATMYWTIRNEVPGALGKLFLQYYLFYYFDYLNPSQVDFCDKSASVLPGGICVPHEADWELIQLEFEANDPATIVRNGIQPTRVAYSQHGWSEDKSWQSDEIELRGDHPVAYVALGKHANYFGPRQDRSDETRPFGIWDSCQQRTGEDELILPSLGGQLADGGTQSQTTIAIEAPWFARMCEVLDESQWRVSIAQDEISDFGSVLLPPEMASNAMPCHQVSEDFNSCVYQLHFIDDATPWVAYSGRWGGDKKIAGPDDPTRWYEPHVWANLCADDVLACVARLATTSDAPQTVGRGEFISVSAGYRRTCAVKADGNVMCWGHSGVSRIKKWFPIIHSGEFASVHSGLGVSCGLTPDGTIECWSHFNEGSRRGFPPIAIAQFTSASIGDTICGLTKHGLLICRGDPLHFGLPLSLPPPPSASGELARPRPSAYVCDVNRVGAVDCLRTDVDDIGKASVQGGFVSYSTAIFLDAQYSCATTRDGSAICWGLNDTGALHPPTGDFISVGVGPEFACGLEADGTAKCWGKGFNTTDFPGNPSFASLSVHNFGACGLRTDSTIECWGNGFVRNRAPSSGGFTSVSVGWDHACGLKRNGTIECWGSNEYGQSVSPDRVVSASMTDEQVCGLRLDNTIVCWGAEGRQLHPPSGEFESISLGGAGCGIRPAGNVQCWGVGSRHKVSSELSGEFISVDAGSNHACAIRTDDSVACTGYDDFGESSPPPGGFLAVSAGWDHTCGIRLNRTVACWGSNKYRQASPPSGEFTSVSAGEYFTCGIRADGTVSCWGGGNLTDHTPPSGEFVYINAGVHYPCGVRPDGTAECWGTKHDRTALSPPSGTYRTINDRCGLGTDGFVACWYPGFYE